MSDTNPSFAQAFEQLESLTAEFEQGDIDLEKAIPKFKKAVELAKFLKVRLNELENQIEEINADLMSEAKETAEVSSSATPAIETEPAEDQDSDDIPF